VVMHLSNGTLQINFFKVRHPVGNFSGWTEKLLKMGFDKSGFFSRPHRPLPILIVVVVGTEAKFPDSFFTCSKSLKWKKN
jgi:hypothetical protein